MTRHIRQLGNKFRIELPPDNRGYVGRECPECDKYFKIRPDTGARGETLPSCCPYCGVAKSSDAFHTQAQIRYAESVVLQRVEKAVAADLEDLARDFNRRTTGGLFPVKMEVKASLPEISRYAESELETEVECGNCRRQYAIFGLFAFCPDCRTHNSLQILEKNLELIDKMLDLARREPELRDRLIENAMEDCVSTFDGFGREVCRVLANATANPSIAKLSFQNLEGARATLKDALQFDLGAPLTPAEWADLVHAFQKRHLIAHKMGVADEAYVAKAGASAADVGRRVVIRDADVRAAARLVGAIARGLAELIPQENQAGT